MKAQDELTHTLEEGLTQLGLSINALPLLHYLNLLHKWNQAYNLTAVREKHAMVYRHLLDSLAVFSLVKGPRLLDVGSGAGLPGIPLAIAHPFLQVVLVDSNGKKIRFLQAVKRELKLANVEIVQSRVENYHPAQGFDTVISRAFSDVGRFLTWTSHLVAPQGIWLAMKGRYPEAELNNILCPWLVKTYVVPGQPGERCCIMVKKE